MEFVLAICPCSSRPSSSSSSTWRLQRPSALPSRRRFSPAPTRLLNNALDRGLWRQTEMPGWSDDVRFREGADLVRPECDSTPTCGRLELCRKLPTLG